MPTSPPPQTTAEPREASVAPPRADPGQPVLPAALLKAARRIMRPLVRLMMQSGVTFPVLSDTLRHLFVEVAVTELLLDPKAKTDSRVSLLSGVHRKEIKRLRSLPADHAEIPDVVTMASQIVARWLGSAAFADAEGHPRILPRQAQPNGTPDAGEGPAFEDLVLSVTSDVRPRAVLDDLLSHEVVSLMEGDRVRLNTHAFIPRPGGAEQLFYFARNLHDHVAAATANISASKPPFFDRSVHYDDLTPAQAETLRAYAREVAIRALLEVNRKALDLLEDGGAAPPAASTPAGGGQRVNLGIYLYQDADGIAGDKL
ncbi:MAG TPA: DUF6502 family protein [Rhodopila sp.]|nr:DUF6502 family protein [Rhodopila sp.]